MPLDLMLFIVGCLLFMGVLAGRASGILGVPALLLFILVGMVAGSEGPGGIYFDNHVQARDLGIVALIFILFSGGMDTSWDHTRPLLGRGLALSTIGVVVTTALVAGFCNLALGFSPVEGILIGAIVASTDAAAVFGLLRSRGVPLKTHLSGLLELESGSNDPLAVFLTVSCIAWLKGDDASHSALQIGGELVIEMALGVALGWLVGRGGVILMRRLRLPFDALFHVLSIVVLLISYSGTALVGGNGFLAVYVAGLTYGNGKFHQLKGLRRFHEGLAWLMQIAMFLALGLLVFPSRLVAVAGPGLLLALFLMIVARPIGVVASLLPFRTPGKEMVLLGWTGLRGAVPIVLATFPAVAGVHKADLIFNLVFFVVLLSALLQGTTMPYLATKLGLLEGPPKTKEARQT